MGDLFGAASITQKLLDARRSFQTIHGAGWRSALQPYMDVLEGLHKAKGIPYLNLGLQLSKELQEKGLSPLALFAATVELIEPTPKVPL